MNAAFRTIRVERGPASARVVLNRPSVRNAFDATMIDELSEAFLDLAKDASLRAVVVDGEGPVFCSGADAVWMRSAGAASEAAGRADARRLADLFAAFEATPCITFVVARGAALGGGAGLVAAADVAIAEEGTKFGFTEVRLGIIPAVVSSFAIRAIGARAARRYFVTGEIFDAARAAELGLVSEVVPVGMAASRVEAIVRDLLKVGPRASREAKRLVEEVVERPYPDVLDHCASRIAAIRRTSEAQEGLAAFLEKRAPVWPKGDA